MSGTIRSFLAFDIEDHKILRRLAEVQGMLANSGADLKMVKPQNVHMTIRFLGDIDPHMVDSIYQVMKQVSYTPFTVELVGLGAFPNPNYPRVVWVGIKKGVNELKDVFKQLEPRFRGLGFNPDTKGFSPHLTIARLRTGRNKARLGELVRELVDYEFGIVKVECLRLKKSDLNPRGPIYTNLCEVCG